MLVIQIYTDLKKNILIFFKNNLQNICFLYFYTLDLTH